VSSAFPTAAARRAMCVKPGTLFAQPDFPKLAAAVKLLPRSVRSKILFDYSDIY
jgi:hypothetical protein